VRPWRNALGPLGVALAVAALTAWAFWIRARFLFATPYPVGIDGYYYAVQLRDLIEQGRLHYPSAPLAFWLMAPAAWLADPITAAKLGAAAGTALGVVPAYLLARRLCGERVPALLGAALVATSAGSFYLSTEFVKQGLGTSVALAFVAAVPPLAGGSSRSHAARWALAALLLVATFLAHKTSFVLALLVAAPLLVRYVVRGGAPAIGGAAAGVALAVAAIVVLGFIQPQRFLAAHDLALVGRTLRPTWSLAPIRGLALGHEVLRAGLVACALLALQAGLRLVRRDRPPAPLPELAWSFVALALALLLPVWAVGDDQGLTLRVRVLAFVALGPLAALLVVRALAFLAPALRAWVAAGAAAGLLLALPARPGEGAVLTDGSLVQAVRALDGAVPEAATVVVPERHLVFMAAWYARVAARLKPGPAADPSGYRMLNLPNLAPEMVEALRQLREHPEQLPGAAPPRDLHPYQRDGLVVLTEATFQQLLERLPPAVAARYRDWPTH
jgi:hypothetical protein